MGVIVAKAVRVRRVPAQVGVSNLVGTRGTVRRDGLVFVNGELWRARTPDDTPLPPGTEIEVADVEDDLRLLVRQA
jgi:membrane protein implicated in regulation of membrane protease activity